MQWTSAPNIGEAPLPQQARSYWKTRISALHEKLERLLERERAQLPPWLAVGFGSGIAAGFALAPGRSGRTLGWFATAAALGCGLVWLRSDQVAAPRLGRPVVATFDARVERVESLVAKDSVRLTLAPGDPHLPPRVRVSVAADAMPDPLDSGAAVRLRARLAPPPPM